MVQEQHAARKGTGPIEAVSDLVLVAGHLRPKTVIIAGGDRPEDIRLVESARDHGIIDRCLLVGNEASIRDTAAQLGVDIEERDILATGSNAETAARTVERVREGGIDIILKGNIPTPDLNRAMMSIAVRDTISLVTMFDTATVAEGRPLLLTDPGVTTVCNTGRMVGLIENAVDVARAVLGLERPRVALLSANEKVIASLASTRVAEALSRRRWDNAVVYGPLSLDLAVDPDSVRLKGQPDCDAAREVAGQADILICPGIDAANVLYKMIMENVKFGLGTFAGITVGVMVPYVILSRADDVETKLQSLALCSIASERLPAARPQQPVATPKAYRVLTVNPGNSSTKVALFVGNDCLAEDEVQHDPLPREADYRREVTRRQAVIAEFLAAHDVGKLDAVVGRGGFLPRPSGKLAPGTYVVAEQHDGRTIVDEHIVEAILRHAELPHASNLGIPLAAELARRFGVPAFTVDPVVSDEFCAEAEFSGYAGVQRRSIAHVLSVREAVRLRALKTGTRMEDQYCVVAHLGSGITVAAIRQGRMVDNMIALLGEGPFTPQRVGKLPMGDLIELCYSGRFSQAELIKKLTLEGGLRSYLGDHRMEEIQERIAAGDEYAARVVEAMVYQIAKAIGAMLVVAGAQADAIILTGGLSKSPLVVRGLKQTLGHLLPVTVLPETGEMAAMARGACRVLDGSQPVQRYQPPDR